MYRDPNDAFYLAAVHAYAREVVNTLESSLDARVSIHGNAPQRKVKHTHVRPLLDLLYLARKLYLHQVNSANMKFAAPEDAKLAAELINRAFADLFVNNEGCTEAFRDALFCEPTMGVFRKYLRKQPPRSPALEKCYELGEEVERLKMQVENLKQVCEQKDAEIRSLKETVVKYGRKLGFFRRVFA